MPAPRATKGRPWRRAARTQACTSAVSSGKLEKAQKLMAEAASAAQKRSVRTTLQKAWQAKTDTDGSISVEFEVESADPYVPGRDFDVGDLVGVRAWGVVWAAVVSEMTWTSRPGEPDGLVLKLGNMESLADAEALLARNAEAVRSVLGRLATAVNGSG